jgi:hypothetical protein
MTEHTKIDFSAERGRPPCRRCLANGDNPTHTTNETNPPNTMNATRTPLDAARWHWQHGAIDLILSADGEPSAVQAAYDACWTRFVDVLPELVSELTRLQAQGLIEGAALFLQGRARVTDTHHHGAWFRHRAEITTEAP